MVVVHCIVCEKKQIKWNGDRIKMEEITIPWRYDEYIRIFYMNYSLKPQISLDE